MSARPWAVGPATDWTGPDGGAPAVDFHRTLDGYTPTALVPLPALAERLGVGEVLVKDESDRFGLPAFKALGASWAVNRALAARLGAPVPATFAALRDLAAGRDLGLVTATDGNHGRALAYMASLLGLRARVHVPGGLEPSTLAAIRDLGAEVVDTGETYDDAVRAAAASVTGDELLVQDTAWPGYEDVPGWIVDGYTTMLAEIDAATTPDVLVVPTGVDSLLQAVLQHHRAPGRTRTRVLAVEPVTAACVAASLAAGEPVTVDTSAPTIMAGLNCGTVSSLAWPAVAGGLDAAVGVTDAEADAAMRDLHDLGVRVGPCGASSLAGLTAALGIPEVAAALDLGPTTRVVLLSTEGAAANAARHSPTTD